MRDKWRDASLVCGAISLSAAFSDWRGILAVVGVALIAHPASSHA